MRLGLGFLLDRPGKSFILGPILIIFDPKITPKNEVSPGCPRPPGLLLFTEAYCCSVNTVNDKNSVQRLTFDNSTYFSLDPRNPYWYGYA